MHKLKAPRCIKRRGLFATLILSYTALLLISMLFVGLSYCRLYGDAREHAESTVVSHMNQASSIADSYVERVQQTLLALCTNAHVNAFANARYPLNGTDYFRLWQVVQTVSEQASANPLLDMLYIYFQGIDSVVDANTRTGAQDYFDGKLRFVDQTYEQWQEFLGQTGYFTAFGSLTTAGGARYIPFTMTLPLGTRGRNSVVGCMNVDNLETLFTGIGSASEYSVLIALDGRVVCTLGGADEHGQWAADESGFAFASADGREYLQLSIAGAGDWMYYCAFEANAYLDTLSSTRQFILQMLIMELASGLLCAVLLAINSYSPLRRIMRALNVARRPDGGGKNDVQQMLDAATELIAENRSLNARLQQQEPLLRAGLMQQLLSGDRGISRAALQQAGIALDHACSCVAMIGAGDNPDGEARTVFYFTLSSVLGEWLEQKRAGYALMYAPDRIAVLINADEQAIPELTREMIEYIASALRFTPIAGISAVARSLDDAYIACAQAQEAFNYAYAWRIEGMTRYDELSHELRAYILTPAQEQELIADLQGGQAQAACDMVRRLFCDARNEPLIHIRMLAYGIITVCMRTIADWKTPTPLIDQLDDLGARIDAYASPDELMEDLGRIAAGIARESGKLHDGSNSAIVQRTIDIINARFADAALSQAGVAQELQLNPSYLSHAFKQQSGSSFVDYLNGTRLEHARAYLSSTSMSIQAIAECCGYTSAGYFNRVFKKRYGLTPGQFRDGVEAPPVDGAPDQGDASED